MKNLSIQSKPQEEYSEKYHDHAFEQYKMYLQTTDRISTRRHAANTFFLSINTALVTLAGYAKAATSADAVFYFITSLAGVLICYTWYRLVLSYRNLNAAKFKLILAMENQLPYRLYDAEWETLGRGEDKQRYHSFTSLEMRIPFIFASIHLLVLLYAAPWWYIIDSY